MQMLIYTSRNVFYLLLQNIATENSVFLVEFSSSPKVVLIKLVCAARSLEIL